MSIKNRLEKEISQSLIDHVLYCFAGAVLIQGKIVWVSLQVYLSFFFIIDINIIS